MKTPPPWQDEKKRLEALWQYAVLDTPPEEAFDNLTALAAQICEAPIALISLVDENRQWFKSKVGLTASETARDISFCGHAIHQSGLFIVPDATRDERFADNPLVTAEPRIRFYAGAPLVSPEGQPLGTLCVIDHVPRKLSPGRQESLRVLSRQVMAQLELRRRSRELARAHSERDQAQKTLLKEQADAEVPRRAIEEQKREGSGTQRKNAALHQSGQGFQFIFEQAADGILLTDVDSQKFLLGNETICRMLGCSRDELNGLGVADIHPPESLPHVREQFKKLLQHEITVSKDIPVRRRDGNIFYADISTALVTLDGKNYMAGFFRDVTERRRAEAALQENQRQLAGANQMLQMVMDTIPVRIFWKDKDSVYLGCNRLFAEDAGLKSPEDILGKTDYDLGWREQAELYRKDDMEVMRSGNSKLGYEEPQTAPNGKHLWLRTSKIPLRDINNRVIGILGTYEDITTRKQAEEALRQSETALDKANRELQRDIAEHKQMQKRLGESERKARAIFDLSFGFIGLLTPDGSLVEANRSALDFAGVQLSDVVGKPLWETPWWAHSTNEQEQIRAAVRTAASGELTRFETTFLATNGMLHTFDFSLKPMKDEAGRVVLLIPQGRDITDRKRAEEAHARLAIAVEQAAETIVITDTSGQILYVNPAFEKTSGYPREEAVGKNPRILKSGKHDSAFYHQMWESLTHGRVWSGRIINKKKNGALYEEEMTISPIRDSSGKITNYVTVKRDVTQEVALEEQLRQAQKMESIGQLAGGVAHDFNNILVVIQGNASLLLEAKNLSEPDADLAKQIINAAERAAGLTRQLLVFGRKQVMQPDHLNLNQVAGNMTKMLQRILGEDVALRSDYSPALPAVFADAGMIEQVLLNLAVNARDAMPAGGRLMIATASKTLGQEYAQQNPAAVPGQYVCLSVTDTGCGIVPENLSHIFEPFFTTKGVGKGTGLGLATVYAIVKQHRGWIEVDSQVDKGTTFRIFLPAAREINAKQKSKPVTHELPRGDEVILVVEDEQAVRLLVGNLLQRCGYTALLAVSGIEALNLWEQHKNEIQLLLTDMVLPDGMMGRELAEKLTGEKPKLKVVYTSGYSASVVGKGPALVEGVNFLQKPYHPQKLAQTVRDCLDQK